MNSGIFVTSEYKCTQTEVKKDISIIIINYNTCKLLCDCLDSIQKQVQEVDYETIVLDNASTDDSCTIIKQLYQWVRLIELQKNIGFGKANNLAFSRAKGEVLFLLNSDTILIDNAVKVLYDFLKNDPLTGACGGLLLTSELLPTFSYGYKLSLKQDFLTFFNLQLKSSYATEVKDQWCRYDDKKSCHR